MTANSIEKLAEAICHFWAPSGPTFSSALLFCGNASRQEPKSSGPQALLRMKVYDVDGAIINTVELEHPQRGPHCLDLSPLVYNCKNQGGFRHVRLACSAFPDERYLLRVQAKETVALFGSLQRIDGQHNGFLPVSLGTGRYTLLACCNLSNHDAQLRVRLFCGKRSPETSVAVPAQGTRVIALEHEFREFSFPRGDEVLQAYVRLTCKPGTAFGIQMMDSQQSGNDLYTISGVA